MNNQAALNHPHSSLLLPFIAADLSCRGICDSNGTATASLPDFHPVYPDSYNPSPLPPSLFSDKNSEIA
jgi:hypothetical protein